MLSGLFYILNALSSIGYLQFLGVEYDLVPTGHPLLALMLVLQYGAIVFLGIVGVFRYNRKLISTVCEFCSLISNLI